MKLERLTRTPAGQWVVLAAIAIPVLQLLFPQIAYAQVANTVKTNPNFEIKITNEKISQVVAAYAIFALEGDNPETVTSQIDLTKVRAEQLKKYFTEVRPSPLANYAEVLAEQPQWRKIVAISFVESTMCKRHYYNNCWGITYRSGLAKYPSFKEAITDTNRVLAKSYATRTYQQMNCVYVQPCNPRWVKGVLQIEAELDKHVEARIN